MTARSNLAAGFVHCYRPNMSDITTILTEIDNGDPSRAEKLLPLVYQELRRLAEVKLLRESPGQTLQATALVHEAYIRLLGKDPDIPWDSKGHFFAAAAESMRRILVDRARRKQASKHGGGFQRIELLDPADSTDSGADELLELDRALDKLNEVDEMKAKLVQLRYFAGLTIPQAAKSLGIAPSTADKYWTYAKAWLRAEMS